MIARLNHSILLYILSVSALLITRDHSDFTLERRFSRTRRNTVKESSVPAVLNEFNMAREMIESRDMASATSSDPVFTEIWDVKVDRYTSDY